MSADVSETSPNSLQLEQRQCTIFSFGKLVKPSGEKAPTPCTQSMTKAWPTPLVPLLHARTGVLHWGFLTLWLLPKSCIHRGFYPRKGTWRCSRRCEDFISKLQNLQWKLHGGLLEAICLYATLEFIKVVLISRRDFSSQVTPGMNSAQDPWSYFPFSKF